MNIDTLIREVNPAPRDALAGPDSFEAEVIFERSMSEPPPPKRRPVIVGGLTLGTLGIAAGVALLISSFIPDSPTRPTSAAAATLAHLADVAAAQPATNAPGPGQFEYTESESLTQNCDLDQPSYCYQLSEHRQLWVGSDDSGRLLETFATPSFATSADRAAWVSHGSPALSTGTSDTTFGPNTMSIGPPGFSDLPTDPTALGAELSARKIEGGPPGPAEDFVQIGDLLRETDASPALRSALYQVAETIPGATLLGPVHDHLGRQGVGIGRIGNGIENEYIFDPTTSALLSEQQVATVANAANEGEAAGTVLGWTVYLSSGIVDSLSDTPTDTVTPAPPVSCTEVPGSPGESHCTNGP